MATIFFIALGCNSKSKLGEQANEIIDLKENQITSKDIEQLKYVEFVLSNLSEKAISNWLKFQEFNGHMEILKKGDLSFFKDEKAILQTFFIDFATEIPESINTPSILVRLSVLESTVLKLEGISKFNNVKKEIVLAAIREVLIAHSNLILQINKKFELDSQNVKKPV